MKNQDTPTSSGSAAALTARITATLGPLDADEQACCEKLEELERQVADLQEQFRDAEDNLRIIKAAKVDAIRSLMGADPLLAQAFGAGDAPAEAAEAPAAPKGKKKAAKPEEVAVAVAVEEEPSDVVEAVEQDDEEAGEGNPLLKLDDD